MPKPAVLVVDDEPDICELLSITLERMSLAPHVAGTIGAAQRMLKTEQFDLCLTDMRLPDGDGLDLVKWIQQYSPSVPVAVITAHGNMETAVRALKLGAFDFVSKPLGPAGICASWSQLRSSCPDTNDADTSVFGPRLLGTSAAMQHLREMIASRRAQPGAGAYISANPAPARNWWRSSSTNPGRDATVHLFRELRRDPDRTHGKRAIRPQARQLHRGRQRQEGAHSVRGGRHAVSR